MHPLMKSGTEYQFIHLPHIYIYTYVHVYLHLSIYPSVASHQGRQYWHFALAFHVLSRWCLALLPCTHERVAAHMHIHIHMNMNMNMNGNSNSNSTIQSSSVVSSRLVSARTSDYPHPHPIVERERSSSSQHSSHRVLEAYLIGEPLSPFPSPVWMISVPIKKKKKSEKAYPPSLNRQPNSTRLLDLISSLNYYRSL